tara:strand:+ start:6822 stop:8711 length:1890 start_codon:yes stop_codon:yes gene_type:complete
MNPIDILVKYWGHTNFRLKQEKIINDILVGKDVLALLPTGGGKSICYQVPTLLKEGICLVISPLISLMDDQVRHLKSKGIKSIAITSDMHYNEIDTALTNCIYGGIKFLYLSPEKLRNKLVQNRIQEMKINMITVDEAHCISEWGHNFRPAYRYISEIRSSIPNTPVLALTATATTEVIHDIQNNLLFKKNNLIRSSFRRDNISYIVDNKENKKLTLINLLNKIKSSVIVYTSTRKATKEIANFLIKNDFSATCYHGGLSREIRTERQKKWGKNQVRIIVATNAFGMGIHKADVKLVVHMDLPSTIEAYFQEAGRTGRNGETAYAFLLANKTDIKKQENLLKLRYPNIKDIIDCYQNIANYLQIAIGDLPEDPIPFDIIDFSNRYKTGVLKTYNILKYLEKEEKLKLSNNINSPSTVMINVSNTELYKFQISNRYYDAFIKLLLRSYSNLFNHHTVINENQIAKDLKESSIQEVKEVLQRLHRLEIIRYQEQNNLPKIKYLRKRENLSALELSKKKLEERKSYESSKLKKISRYIIRKDSCRSKILLHYFSEETSYKCGVCDVCIGEKRKTTKDQEYDHVSSSIKQITTKDKSSIEGIPTQASNIKKDEVINILNFLSDNDKIDKFDNK